MRRDNRGGRSITSLLMVLLILVVAAIALMLVKPEVLGSLISQEKKEPTVEQTTIVNVGEVAPDFSVTMSDGNVVTLSALRGKVVLLNFWATWCPPCREELTHVQAEILDRFADKSFVMLPISRGEEQATVDAFIAEKGYQFKVGYDPQRAIYDKYATNYIPRNFVIDADGRVSFVGIGYDAEEFAEMIQQIEMSINKISK